MQFLVDIMVYYYKTPVLYKVSRISDNEYFAEPNDHSLGSFKLLKVRTGWTSEGVLYVRQVKEVSKRLEMFLDNSWSGKL
jgi:hypothetical protein